MIWRSINLHFPLPLQRWHHRMEDSRAVEYISCWDQLENLWNRHNLAELGGTGWVGILDSDLHNSGDIWGELGNPSHM